MTSDFNASDIFDIAIQIEQNGAEFYKTAADKAASGDHKDFLLELAAMEEDHEKTFAALKKELSENDMLPAVFDPEDENALYLKALADMRVFFDKDFPGNDFKQVMKSAIQAEKDSIVFYLGMKAMVPEKRGKDKIDAIIKEEMGHIRILARKMIAS